MQKKLCKIDFDSLCMIYDEVKPSLFDKKFTKSYIARVLEYENSQNTSECGKCEY